MLNIHTNRSNKAEFDPYGLYTFSPASNLQHLLILRQQAREKYKFSRLSLSTLNFIGRQ